jgi:hypothetical protein
MGDLVDLEINKEFGARLYIFIFVCQLHGKVNTDGNGSIQVG